MIANSPSPSIGRPRTFDTDDIVDAALELFWRDGYQATTTRALEAHLGLSQSSIYNAFGTKQNLLNVALERYEARITSELLEPLEQSELGLEALQDFFRALGHWVAHDGRRGCMIINLMAEDGGAAPEISKRTRRYRNRVREAFRQAVLRAAERGETAAELADARADLLLGMVLGLNIAVRGGASAAELRRFVTGAQVQIGKWREGAE